MKKIITLLSVFAVFGIVPQAHAISAGDLKGWNMFTSGAPQNIVANILNYVLFIVGLLAVGYLIYGGIIYLTAAGNEDKTKAGKNAIVTAVIGLIIIAIAILIVRWVAGALNLPI